MSINNKNYYLNLLDRKDPNGGSKAKADFNVIFTKLGFQEIDISCKGNNCKIIRFIYKQFIMPFVLMIKCTSLKKSDALFVQVPLYTNGIIWKVIFMLKKIKKIKLVVVIHDIERLRKVYDFKKGDLRTEDEYIRKSDTIICHNESMKQYLMDFGISSDNIVILGIFDYLLDADKKLKRASYENVRKIVISGSMHEKRSPYIYKLLNSSVKGIELYLYGPLYNPKLVHTMTNNYQGCYPSDKIPFVMEGGWGLVWDGDSIEDCTGNYGEYLPYINQHKVSLYIAAGIPILIWYKAGLAQFVTENKIGIAITDLRNLNDVISKVDLQQYNELVNNIISVRENIIKGKYAQNAIEKALQKCRVNNV